MTMPGVITNEKDLVVNLQLSGSLGAGFTGWFNWGEIGVATRVGIDESQLVSMFGKPTDDNAVDWFSAANFMAYVPNLTVVRVAGVGAMNASSDGTGVLIRNNTEYLTTVIAGEHMFASRYAGAMGNSITVSVADSSNYSTWAYKTQFDTAPASSDRSGSFVADALDEMHIIVIDRLGLFTGVVGAVLEKHAYVSKASDALDASGQSLYYKNVIDSTSAYLYCPHVITSTLQDDPTTTHSVIGAPLSAGKPFIDLTAVYTVNLAGGANGTTPLVADYVSGFETICALKDVSVRYVFVGNCGGDANYGAVTTAVATKVTDSGIRVAFFSPKISDVQSSNVSTVAANITETYSSITLKNSYTHFSNGVKMIFDKYNNKYRIIPTNSDDAGIYCIIGSRGEHWQSGAGYNRGKYRNTIRLMFEPEGAIASEMDRMGINNVITEDGEGVMLFGDHTGQGKNSPFRYMGTRFLFIELRIVIKNASKYNLFDFNTDYSRSQFVNEVSPLLREYRGKNAINDGACVCDSRNNPTSVIERGEFVGSIIIKPNYSVQNIILNFSAIGRNVEFDEVVQQ